MARAIWDRVLGEFQATHEASADLKAFCAFPDDVAPQRVTPSHIPAADLFQSETGYSGGSLTDALIAAGPLAQWRETYKGTDIGTDFLDRFGCYCLIGAGGAFQSTQVWAWVVYMPPHLHYPWHHHPAEEIYLVLAGEADFHRKGAASLRLKAGGTSFHVSNQPHAMTTTDAPVMALVMWRNGFETPPELSG